MAKFLVTRKRMVTQEATFEIDVDPDKSPIRVGEAVDPDVLKWATIQATYLSSDVEPVKEAPVDEPEQNSLFPLDEA